MQLSEERFRMLWAARRDLYARVLEAADDWHKANLDLDGVELDIQVEVSTLADAEEVSPEGASVVRSMYAFGKLVQEMHIISDSEVRGAVEHMRKALSAESRASINRSGGDSTSMYGRALGLLQYAMRWELIHGTGASTTEDTVADPKE
jgi:hypothetical protein